MKENKQNNHQVEENLQDSVDNTMDKIHNKKARKYNRTKKINLVNSKMDSFLEKKMHVRLILGIIIMLQLAFITYNFSVVKQGYHSDELWMYGLSNSYYQPQIYVNDNGTEFINYDEWFSGDKLRDYLVVNKGEQFAYGSVWYNASLDLHPPLYYAILHTICSFFVGKYSVWFGFFINIIAFIFTQIYLYKTANIVFKSKYLGLLVCLFYGFTTGALGTYVLIRPYGMIAGLAIALLYLHGVMYREKNPTLLKHLLPIVLVTLAGCLTHHFFIIYAGILAACFCVSFLTKKKLVDFFTYGMGMINSILLTVLCFPATIDHLVRGNIVDIKYPFLMQVKICSVLGIGEMTGISIPLFWGPIYAYVIAVVIMAAIIILPLSFAFRKDQWFRDLINNIKKSIPRIFRRLCYTFKHMNILLVISVALLLGVVMLIAYTISVPGMGIALTRYFMIIYPMFSIVLIGIIYYLFKWFRITRKYTQFIVSIMIIILLILGTVKNESIYLFQNYTKTGEIAKVVKDNNVIVANNDEWMFICFTAECMEAKTVFNIKADDMLNSKTEIDKLQDDGPVYLLIDQDIFFKNEDMYSDFIINFVNGSNQDSNDVDVDKLNKYEAFYDELEISSEVEVQTVYSVFGRNYLLYKIR